jgi:AcrR family transcriptional regulator
MARSIPVGRMSELVEVATKIFIDRGFRLTQMADVAEALGVAKGTIYGYVESKEALFDASIRFADGHAAPPAPQELPLLTPKAGATVEYIRARIASEAGDMLLLKVVGGERVGRNARDELAAVLADLYGRIARNRLALKLVDRCAADFPDLANAWFGEGRWAQHQLLVELIKTRVAKRRYRRVDNPEVVARTILETIAFWAMHRHFDASPQDVDDAIAEATVIDLVVHSLLVKS